MYRNTGLRQETRKFSKRQPNITPKGTKRRTKPIPKISRTKEIIKIRTKINEIKT